MLQRRQSADESCKASILCNYDGRNGDLFVLNWVRVQHFVSYASDMLIEGAIACISLYIFLLLRYVVTGSVYACYVFVL